MTQEDAWPTDFTRRIAQEIKLRRGKRSAQWLSDRTAHFGHRVGRARISDLETGRRTRIDVSELFILARALDTVPLLLLFPGIPNAPVEVLPGVEAKSWDAAQWVSGEQGLRTDAPEGGGGTPNEDVDLGPRVGDSATHRLFLLRLHDHAVERWEVIDDLEIEATRSDGDMSARYRDLDAQRAQTERDVRELRMLLMQQGVQLPDLPAALADVGDIGDPPPRRTMPTVDNYS